MSQSRKEAAKNLAIFANILIAATVMYTIGYILKTEPLRTYGPKPAK
jgi:hypothetical protein